MPMFKRYRFNATTGGYELVQQQPINEVEQLQLIFFFNHCPHTPGFYKYAYSMPDGTECEAFTSHNDVLGYLNANHLTQTTAQTNDTGNTATADTEKSKN